MIGKRIVQLHEVDSTNNYAAKLLTTGDLDHGTVILADFQTAGKGQRGKNWLSSGSKQFIGSYYLKTDFLSVEHLCFFNMAVAVAIANAIQSYIAHPVAIKWPNDILVNDQKIAGILIETNWKNTGIEGAIVGIGINFNPVPDVLHATSIKEHAEKAPDLFDFVTNLSAALSETYDLLRMRDFETLKKLYLERLWKKDELIHHIINQNDQSSFSGTIRGVDALGNLLLQVNEEVCVFHNHELNFQNCYKQNTSN